MSLAFRLAAASDFAAFYHACFCHDRDNQALRTEVEHEWHLFLGAAPDLSMIVEDGSRPVSQRIVGFAQTVFVSDRFVEHMVSGVPPHANAHASRHLPDGSWPLLNAEEIRAANSGDGLNALTTRWMWTEDNMSDEQRRQVREYMDQNYPLFYRGYRYKHLLIEAIGYWPCQALIHVGYRVLTDYAEHFRQTSRPPLPHKYPYLMGVTREEAFAREGVNASRLFAYTPPRLRLKPQEQDLLWLALLGFSDEQAAERLNISIDTVKKRWMSAFERVADTDPSIFPRATKASAGTRGETKRHTLLEHVREHLEELRPTQG